MPAQFQNSALTAIYNGSGDVDIQAALQRFRTGQGMATVPDIDTDIDSLDKRIATFESVLFSTLPNNGGNAANEYPYDKEGMKREFLDEVLALLLRRSVDADGDDFVPNEFVATNILVRASSEFVLGESLNLRKGSDQRVIAANTGASNFGNLAVTANADTRRNLLNDSGKRVYDQYARLIDAVFLEGEKLALNPSRNVQVSAAIPGLTIEGFTYERIATESVITTNPPTLLTYLVEAEVPNSTATKDGSGNLVVTGPASSTANRLLLQPRLASGPSPFTAVVDTETIEVSLSGQTVFVESRSARTPVAATTIEPFRMPVPGKEDAFPSTYLQVTHRAVPNNGVPYLVGTSSDGGVYVISVAASKRAAVNTTATLSSIEYLYFFNEARIKILRAKLAYNEAVVREIQDDLKRANEVLADLEARSGLVRLQDKDGNITGEYSSETLKMNLFNATNSSPGQSIFSEAGSNSLHTAGDWQENRTNLKNYIDRRSAEAQQATLDYQNVLNRFNNAFEVMGKLQEKLDTLLKAQLRNMG
jgi:hypothetical protein